MRIVKRLSGLMWSVSLRTQVGQAYTEYGLILFLIGITVIGALTLMGQQVHTMWHTISASMPH